jgi:hypothetical protein
MQQFIAILIFCIVLFLYLHIYFQLKTSNDLEVYEIEQPSKDKLEEICDLRQPVIFDYQNDSLLESCKINTVAEHYSAFDVKLRNVKELDENTDLHIPITLKVALSLFNSDKDSKYIIEKNNDFLEETGLIKNFKYNDAFLRPPMVSNCFYDLVSASQNTETPLQYNVNYRNFYLVTHGKIKIKLIPPKSARYLYPTDDYENFEFRSPLNPWEIQRQYKADFDKIKTLEIELTPGKIVYIPAYWWYSVKFMEPLTSVCVFKYRTYMNTVAILPKLCMKTLQRQNTKREIVKKVRFSKNLAADADASKKYIQKPNNSINGGSKVKGIIKEIKDAPAATDAHSSLETTSVLPDADAAAAGAHTGAHTNEDVSGPVANSNQHENAITLSLTE